MNYKTTIVLLVLMGGVGAYLWFVALGSPTTYQRRQQEAAASEKPGKAVFAAKSFSADDVAQVTIQRHGETATLAEKHGRWMQTRPVRFALDKAKAQKLVDDAVTLRYVSKFTPGKDDQPALADVGLAKPRVTLSFRSAKSNKPLHTIRLGRVSSGGRGYVMVDDHKAVYVVNDALQNALLNTPVSQWREKSVHVPPLAQLDEVTLARPHGASTARKNHGRWFLGRRGRQRADQGALSSLVQAVNKLSIRDFVADRPEDMGLYGLKQPRLRLTLRQHAINQGKTAAGSTSGSSKKGGSKGGSSQGGGGPTAGGGKANQSAQPGRTYTLRVGEPADLKQKTYYATWSKSSPPVSPPGSATAGARGGTSSGKSGGSPGGQATGTSAPSGGGRASSVVFTIGKDIVQSLSKSTNDLRDPRIMLAPPGDVRALNVDRRIAPPLHLRKNAKGWHFGNPAPNFQADDKAVKDLLHTLALARAEGYLPGFSPGKKPAAAVTLETVGGTRAEQLTLFGPRKPDESDDKNKPYYVVLHHGESVGYQVPAEQLAPLFAPRLALRNKTILDLPPKQVTRLTLAQHDGTTFTFTRAPASQPSDHPQGSADPAASSTPSTSSANAGGVAEPTSGAGATTASAGEGDETNQWTLRGAPSFEHDALRQLLYALSPLRVDKWLTAGQHVASKEETGKNGGDGDDPARGRGGDNGGGQEVSATLGSNPTTLTVVAADGSKHTLRVDPDSRRGTLSGVKPMFLLPASFVDKLGTEYRKRTVLALTSDQIQSVTLFANGGKHGGKKVTLKKNDNDLYVDQNGAKVDQKMAAGVFNALAGLRVKHYLSPAPTGHLKEFVKITIKATGGKTYQLQVPPQSKIAQPATIKPAPGGNRPKWFTLDKQTLDALLAPLKPASQTTPSRIK